MIAMAAGFVILSSAFQMLTTFQGKLSAQQETMSRHQDERLGLRVLEEEFRLAGTGSPAAGPPLLTAADQEIEFYANLDGLVTAVVDPVSSLDRTLHVDNGMDWRKGKHILVCHGDQCAEAELARDGQRTTLSLTAPVSQSFPVGSEVFISNRVRYYLTMGRDGRPALMRRVDGGANSLIGEVTYFRLAYLDRNGVRTIDPAAIRRIVVEMRVGDDATVLKTEVGIRG